MGEIELGRAVVYSWRK